MIFSCVARERTRYIGLVSKKQAILEQAAVLMGSKELAAAFNVSEGVLSDWVESPKGLPDMKLAELAEILAAFAKRERAKGR